MTSNEQRAALQRQIWAIANDVRGAVDGWDFKQYVLGTLFYRFISENFIDYITGGDSSVNYAAMADSDPNIAAAKDDAIKTKGYFIRPSDLFVNLTSSPTFALCVSGGGFPLLGDSCSRSTWFLLHRAA